MARVVGFELNPSGQQPTDENGTPIPVGVWGDSDTGMGVFGTSGAVPPGATDIPVGIAGVEGHSFENPGVVGRSTNNTGVAGESVDDIGVFGRSVTGSGILGVTSTSDPGGANGVFGSSTANGNGVVGFVGSQTGVIGSSVRGTGVRGTSTGIGVFGQNFRGRRGGAPGVLGTSDEGPGVRGQSDAGNGAIGVTIGLASGVHGLHFSTQNGSGVSGVSVLGSGVDGFSFAGTGVRGESGSGFAGEFFGDVRVTGAVFKGGGGFEIDHPLDPENKLLAHSFVESPEMLNVYSGTVTTDESGTIDVELPDYFEMLNRDHRYQLTVIGEFAQAIIGQCVRNNRFTIRTDRPSVQVSWQVTGVRQDHWAEANRIAVETTKSAPHYRNPELWDNPKPGGVASPMAGRVAELLPERVRDRADALLQKGKIDVDELRMLIEEVRRGSDDWPRTESGQLEDEWQRVGTLLDRLRPKGD